MNDKMCSSFCMFSLGIRCLEKWSRLLSNITLSLFMTHLWNWKICYGPVFCYQPRSMVPAQHPPATSAVGPAEKYISTPLILSLRILRVSSQPTGLSSTNHRSCRLLEELVEEVLLCFLPATLRAGSESYTAWRDGATSSTALPSAAGSGSYTARPHMLGFFCKGGMKSYLVRTSSTASARSSTPTTAASSFAECMKKPRTTPSLSGILRRHRLTARMQLVLCAARLGGTSEAATTKSATKDTSLLW